MDEKSDKVYIKEIISGYDQEYIGDSALSETTILRKILATNFQNLKKNDLILEQSKKSNELIIFKQLDKLANLMEINYISDQLFDQVKLVLNANIDINSIFDSIKVSINNIKSAEVSIVDAQNISAKDLALFTAGVKYLVNNKADLIFSDKLSNKRNYKI